MSERQAAAAQPDSDVSDPHCNLRGQKVGLFVTCLVDLMRPSIGFAAIRLLEACGCDVVVPDGQTCCGQPAFNAGDTTNARALLLQVAAQFSDVPFVVVPSGSCAGMLVAHVDDLFPDGDPDRAEAIALAAKTHELTAFLVDVCGRTDFAARFEGIVTYHDSCAGLRELGVKTQPRALLAEVDGATLSEMTDCEVCCGFGGTFAVKYPEVSNAIVEKKTAHVADADADLLLAGDLGCLMNMAGKLQREGRRTDVRHIAEVLAGELDAAPIGAPSTGAPVTGTPADSQRG
ncbi:MAG: (Fe-S)-binding protein [Pseudomonadota bacterium]